MCLDCLRALRLSSPIGRNPLINVLVPGSGITEPFLRKIVAVIPKLYVITQAKPEPLSLPPLEPDHLPYKICAREKPF